MKVKFKKVILAFLILLLLVSCSQEVLDNTKYLDDYDYIWTKLEESYPYFGVLEREGIDWISIRDEYREKVASGELDDEKFYDLIKEMVVPFRRNGHLNVIGRDFYHMARSVYSSVGFVAWVDILENSLSESFYRFDENLFDESSYSADNIVLTKIDDEKIAYIKFKSFRHENTEIDQDILTDFYEEIENFDHLIIDIRENGGGSTIYFAQNIVEPLISETLFYESYLLFSENGYNKTFIESSFEVNAKTNETELSQRTYEEIELDQIPNYENINQSDFENLNKAYKVTIEYIPDGRISFEGDIWVLVGNRVYSASEAFSQFCKKTGFATLVGLPTSGDGVAIDPIMIKLPNTGIILRFSTHYGLNLDGQNNEEFGTAPDITIEFGESAYDEVLEIIRKDN